MGAVAMGLACDTRLADYEVPGMEGIQLGSSSNQPSGLNQIA
jgi:hypothetical protein